MSTNGKHVALSLLTYVRYNYFEEVLESIINQIGTDATLEITVDLYIFQDGLLGSESEDEKRAHLRIQDFVRTHHKDINFKSFETNLGPAKAFDYIENFLFEGKGYEFVIFCEDDLVLSRNYVYTLLVLAAQVSNDSRVAMISCFSDHQASREKQFGHSSRLIGMEHHWAFGMFRRAWRTRQILVRPYLRLINAFPYRQRPHEEITNLQRIFGFKPGATSQDYFKACTCAALGLVRLSTQIQLGRYIGRSGLHFNPDSYRKHGFESTFVYDGEIPASFDWSEERFEEILRTQQTATLSQSEEDQFEATHRNLQPAAGIRQSEQWKRKTATAADAIAVYKIFLGRLPENDSVINSLVGKPTSSLLLAALLSDEFMRSQTGKAAIIAAARRIVAVHPDLSRKGKS